MSIVTNSRTETISGSSVTLDLTQPNAGLGGWEIVENIDLTNGGANDLSQVDFLLEPGYVYLGHLYGENILSGTRIPALRFQTAGGSVRSGGTDYYQSAEQAGTGDGFTNTANSEIDLSYASSGNTWTYDVRFTIQKASSTTQRTLVLYIGNISQAAGCIAVFGSGIVNTPEENDLCRLITTASTWNSGVLDVHRMRESIV